MDCISSLVVESVSVSVSSGLELVDFCESLDTGGAGEFGLDSGEVSAFGVFLTSE